MTVKPISPDEIGAAKRQHIPDAVFEAFNAEIALKFDNNRAKVSQKDILARLEASGMNRAEIFEKGYLYVEEAYRMEGWEVSYDKPGYNENYDAIFEFKRG